MGRGTDRTQPRALQGSVALGETQEHNWDEENKQDDFACGQEGRKGRGCWLEVPEGGEEEEGVSAGPVGLEPSQEESDRQAKTELREGQ